MFDFERTETPEDFSKLPTTLITGYFTYLLFLYRGITECYDIQLINLHVSTTVYLYYIKSDYMFRPFMWSSSDP